MEKRNRSRDVRHLYHGREIDMKTIQTVLMLLFLCSCGGGGSSDESTTTTTRYSTPVSVEETDTGMSRTGALRLEREVRILKDLWDRLNENGTAVRWEVQDSDFRKAFKFGMLLEKKSLRLSTIKMDLILKAFNEASKNGMNPDFDTLAKTTLKEK